MKYQVILRNQQGAVFSESFTTKKECQEYLDSFYDPENLNGEIINAITGEELAIKKIKRFHWL